MLCPPEDILGFSPIQENKRSVQLMKIKEKQEKVLRTLLDPKDFIGCGDGI